MRYAGLIKQSLLDYPDEIATVLFTRGCNFRCPYCHNPELLVKPRSGANAPGITTEEALDFLKRQKGFVDAVVITGGEAGLYGAELSGEFARFKELGLLCKLDTNGTNTVLLEQLLRSRLVDYVAMDIKAPLDFRSYKMSAGKLSSEDFFSVRSSIELLRRADVTVQFRTTVVPVLHTPEDIANIARSIAGCELYTLQQFNPLVTLEAGYSSALPYSAADMAEMAEMCRQYVKKVQVVNI
ncbi:MAG: anaerobic ribonucleoside-triphosphate reductase activating protein [Syntrophomonadaceae bacterium]|nr:anaerobic ribonucleoside-triphosphate reductase activating protein [Syntrophomonadaceae bacterium]